MEALVDEGLFDFEGAFGAVDAEVALHGCAVSGVAGGGDAGGEPGQPVDVFFYGFEAGIVGVGVGVGFEA